MSKTYVAGFIFGILLTGLIGVLLVRAARGAGPKQDYDERQLAARNDAARTAFYTVLLYLGFYGAFDALTGWAWCDRAMGAFIGAALGAAVYGIVCLFRDAYFRTSDRPGRYLWMFGGLGVVNLALGLWRAAEGTLLRDGLLCIDTGGNLLCGVLMLLMVLAMVIKLCLDRRAETEET